VVFEALLVNCVKSLYVVAPMGDMQSCCQRVCVFVCVCVCARARGSQVKRSVVSIVQVLPMCFLLDYSNSFRLYYLL
jgi:hypothetical protein